MTRDMTDRMADPPSAVRRPPSAAAIRPATPGDEGGLVALRAVAGWNTTTVPHQFRAMAAGRRLISVAELRDDDREGRRQEAGGSQKPSGLPSASCLLPPGLQLPAPSSQPLIVGTITLEWETDDRELADGRTTAHISNLLVHPDYRRRGIGHALIEIAEREAAARGRAAVTIGVDEPNAYARRLYEQLGYRWFKDTTAGWGRIHVLRRPLPVGASKVIG